MELHENALCLARLLGPLRGHKLVSHAHPHPIQLRLGLQQRRECCELPGIISLHHAQAHEEAALQEGGLWDDELKHGACGQHSREEPHELQVQHSLRGVMELPARRHRK